MTKTTIARFAATTVGVAMAIGFASPTAAQADVIAQLQAQINALMAQLAALQGGVPQGTAVQFNTNLTVGSTGADVTALQQFLVSKGYLQMPAGASYGYFGPITKAAVAAWQAASGISPAVGYFGPISRAAIATQVGTTVPGTPGTPGVGITTPGVEGTITATLNSTPTSVKLYEGDSQKAVMGIQLEAKLSDIKVERVKLELGSSTDFYRKIASRLYIMDGSTVLASVDLNSNTVVKEGSTYSITVSGLNYIVPKDTKKVLTVALDAFGSIDSSLTDGDSWTITIPVDGVRAVDGAGINQFSPSTGNSFSRSFTSEDEIIADANIKVSLNTNSPDTSSVVASEGSDNDELDGLELTRFDIKAEKDSVELVDLDVTIARTGGSAGATSTTFYLMDGSTVIDSVNGTALSVTGGTIEFNDIDYVISKDSTKTLRIVVDIREADSTAATYRATVNSGSAIVAENSVGDTLANGSKTGSATGNVITVRSAGLEITLVSKSDLVRSVNTAGDNSTSSAATTFNLRLRAVGEDVYVGPQASSTFDFQTYVDGTAEVLLVASTTSWSIPSGVNTSDAAVTAGGFMLTDGQEVTIPVSFVFQGATGASVPVDFGSYAVGLGGVTWSLDGSTELVSDFMSGETAWRTSSIVMP